MTQDQGIGIVWAIGAIALVGSALAVRRLPAARLLKMAAIWIAIFAIGLLIVSLIGRGHRSSRDGPAPEAPLAPNEKLT